MAKTRCFHRHKQHPSQLLYFSASSVDLAPKFKLNLGFEDGMKV